ncbi:Uncharacterised protein [Slackia heliotrinireducens]|nr:Uncharacterised protein [Slackia heliotrinireducens]
MGIFSKKNSMSKDVFGGLHVKGSTKGTSNELSLSILEERSSQASEKGASPRTILPSDSLGSGVEVFTVPGDAQSLNSGKKKASSPVADSRTLNLSSGRGGAAASSAAALSNEIARRKRRRHIRTAIISVAILAVAALVAGSGFLYVQSMYDQHVRNLDLLSTSMDELEAADATVVGMDEAIASKVDIESVDDLQTIINSIPTAETHVNAALSFATDADINMWDSEDKEAAGQVEKAAQARLEMFEYGGIILKADIRTVQAMEALDECWATVLAGEETMKQSATLVADSTPENTEQSEQLTYEAISTFNTALDQLSAVRDIYDVDGLDAIESYIYKRIEENEYALASDAAIYIQDKSTADEQNKLYNQADAEALELLKSIPEDPKDLILDAYDEEMEEPRNAYYNARSSAAASDEFLREYLGASAQTD